MSVLAIPTVTDGTEAYDQSVELEGVVYLFAFRYNLRRELWTFSIRALDGRAILTGQTLHVGILLNRRAVQGPPGAFVALSETDDNLASPTLHELGGRVKLYYVTADDVAAVTGGAA